MTSKNMEARRVAFDAWHRAEQEEKWQSALKEFGLDQEPMPEQFSTGCKTVALENLERRPRLNLRGASCAVRLPFAGRNAARMQRIPRRRRSHLQK